MFDATGMSGPELNALSKLKERGFLHEVSAKNSRRFSADWAYPIFPILRKLSIEYDQLVVNHMPRFVEFALSCHARVGTHGVMLFCIESNVLAVTDTIKTLTAESKSLIVDLVVPEFRMTEFLGISQRGDGRVRISGVPLSSIPGHHAFQLPAVAKTSFFCREDFYHLLQTAGESYGCLHINKLGDIYPDPMEGHYKVGHIMSLGLDSLEDRLEESTPYWNKKKQARIKCADCEYRFVCPNPVAARTELSNLNSEPRNCSYSPERGAWA